LTLRDPWAATEVAPLWADAAPSGVADPASESSASQAQQAHHQAAALTQAMHDQLAHGQPDEAFQTGRRALTQWQALQQHERACDVLLTLATACLEHEQALEALALVRHALRVARARVLPPELVRALMTLGALHGHLHDFANGEQLVLQALSRAREQHEATAVRGALNSLLTVLLSAHAAQQRAGEVEQAAATAQRLLRHANHALAQSEPLPRSYADVLLRTHAAAALLACDRAGEAIPVLRACAEGARLQGFRLAGLWARLHSVQATWARSDAQAAATALAKLVSLVGNDDPPRLRLALLALQQRLAEHSGDGVLAATYNKLHTTLQDAQDRQVRLLQDTLRRSAADTFAALAVIDAEWQELGLPGARAVLGPVQRLKDADLFD
jgi:tetratricopeptide (TPR) repeat protein